MQSSTAIAFRALVMLIFFISVPLVALFGKDLPDVLKGLLEGRTLVLTPPTTPNATPAATQPANFGPHQPGTNLPNAGGNVRSNSPTAAASTTLNTGTLNTGTLNTGSLNTSGPYRAASAATLGGTTVGGPSAAPPDNFASNAAPPASSANNSNTVANNSNTVPPLMPSSLPSAAPQMSPAGATSVYGAAPSNQASASTTSPGAPAGPVDWRTGSAANETAAMSVDPPGGAGLNPNMPSANMPGANAPQGMSGAVPMQGEQFRQAEKRLRELGATHYMLETWGPDNDRYRFVCQMAIGGNPGMNRYFQSIDNDPWRAMAGVLEQVESWRSQPQ